jgi:hypothetical protein
MYFDGNEGGDDTSVYLGTNISEYDVTDGTIAFWFKLDDTGDDWQDFFGVNSSVSDFYEFAYERSTNRIHVYTADCDSTNIRGYFALPDPQTDWYHLVYTVDSGGNNFYLNGVQQTVTYTVGSSSTTCFFDDMIDSGGDNEWWTIGCVTNGSSACLSTENYEGYIDDFRLYSSALTQAQVAYSYNRGKPVGHWKLDECQGTTANDSSGNGNSGVITIGAAGDNDAPGSCSSGDSTEAWNNGTTGKVNYSLDLDGADDYITVEDTSDNDFVFGDGSNDKPFSFSTWIKPDDPTYEIISKHDNGTFDYEYRFYVSSSTIRLRLSDDSAGSRISRTAPFSSTSWNHVVATYDGLGSADGIKIYINGVRSDNAYDNGGSYIAMEDIGNDLMIGHALNSGSPILHLDGQIDDVKIFNYALTQKQIINVMNQGAVYFGPSTGAP